MSIEIMTRVWKQSKQTECSRLLLLLALADHCDPDGICFPGIAHLARKIRKTERHVRRLLRDLEKDGEVYTSTNRGPHLANLYLVTVGFTQGEIKATLITRLKVPKENASDLAAMLLTPDTGVPLTPASITPDTGVLPPLIPVSTTPDTGVPLTIINHHINHQESSLSADADSTTETDSDLPIPTKKKSPGYVPGPGKLVACEDPDTGEELVPGETKPVSKETDSDVKEEQENAKEPSASEE